MLQKEIKEVIESGSCCGCGACIALDKSKESRMIDTQYGPIPFFAKDSEIPDDIKHICPCVGVNYPKLYKYFF